MKKKLNLLDLNQMRRIKGGNEALKCRDTCVGCGDASNKKSNRKNMSVEQLQ